MVDNPSYFIKLFMISDEDSIRVFNSNNPIDYLRKVRELCDEKGVLLILDEVQTGFGRTGKMFACMHWNVTPDIMAVAKAIAGGIPMGATLARDDVMLSLQETEHGSTFGGNPLACAAASATIDVIVEEKLPERARELGELLKEGINTIKEQSKLIREVRGLGLMIGVELRLKCKEYVLSAMERGVLLLTSGLNTIRLLPPLVIEREQIERVVQVLSEVLVV
ncbi:MAG: aminotransferase class III-fold pyridoxal phosphate-dependent enzyme, partial [Candidatus Jordarchaeales archaeon]